MSWGNLWEIIPTRVIVIINDRDKEETGFGGLD